MIGDNDILIIDAENLCHEDWEDKLLKVIKEIGLRYKWVSEWSK